MTTTQQGSGYAPSADASGNYVLGKVMNDRSGAGRWHFWTGDFNNSGPQVSLMADKAMTFKTARDAYNEGGRFVDLQYFRARRL